MYFLFVITAILMIHQAHAQVSIYQFVPYDAPLYAVTSLEPRTWVEMRAQCNAEHIGYYLSMSFEQLPPEVVALCPDGSLVPFGVVYVNDSFTWDNVGDLQNMLIWEIDAIKLGLHTVKLDGPYGALLWPSTELRMIGNETKFTCAVCEMSHRLDVVTKGIYPPHNNSIYAYDLELLSYDRIKDISVVGNGSDLSNKLLGDLAEAFNISVKALRWHGATLNEDQKAVVHVYYDREGDNMDWYFYARWNDQYEKHKTVDNFEITMIKLNTECLVGKKFLSNVRKETYLTGSMDAKIVAGSSVSTTKFCNGDYPEQPILAIRECRWDADSEAALWTNRTVWCPKWKGDGTMGPGGIITPIFKLKGEEYKKALKNVDIMMLFYLGREVEGSLPLNTLRGLVPLANEIMSLHSKERPFASAFDVLSYSIPVYVAKLLMKLKQDQTHPTDLVCYSMISMLLSDLDPFDPVVGLAVSLPDDVNTTVMVVVPLSHSNKTHTPDTSHIVVTVSDSIAFSAKRLAISSNAAHLDSVNQTRRYDDSIDGWMAAILVAFNRDEQYGGNLDADFVDIAFKPVFHLPTLRGKCAERNFSSDEWYDGNCRILKSMRDKMLVCRCNNLHKESNVTINMYLIYGFDASLSTYLANNLTLVIVIVFVCFMSALGLLGVVLTAAVFPEWREDQGHKIFLQMTLALSVNLVLGFVNNFISIDTKSIACIGIGVLRHYSFLAMFFWMMVLSGLQVKRLTTIAGAKGTSHLILKVSLIAWGFPLIPIVILLAWDTGFYKSEVSNRGYCYPEDIAFQATVQGPAGVILIANLFIFVIILNHIYGWVKCNKDVVVRKHTADDRTAQLRNLGNSIFVFFLFGFTWTFHFMSEEGIINSEFLFEFLFLITASFHLFMLSLFFILLDKKTRTLWSNLMGCKSNAKVKQQRVK